MLAQFYAAHPYVIHFPVALLTVAPAFLIAGLIAQRHRTVLFTAGWAVAAVGTVGAFVAVESGEAAHNVIMSAGHNADVGHVLEEHEEGAELTRLLFAILTAVWGGLLLAPKVLKREASARVVCITTAVLLLAQIAAVGVLLNTAHLGGRVVHEYHVTAGI